jgi:PIN domain nuclease of toxin-antitoxin system
VGRLPLTYLLDTHVWIWWNADSKRLSPRVRALLSTTDRYEKLLLSAISLWEVCKLDRKKRLGLSLHPEEWMRRALEMVKLDLIPITPTIAYRSTTLPPTFHSDPADQIIVATAIEQDATVITKDRAIRDYKHVRSFW